MFKLFFSSVLWKILLYAGATSMAVWSLVWSWTDGHLNLWPMFWWAVFVVFCFVMSWIFRNNP